MPSKGINQPSFTAWAAVTPWGMLEISLIAWADPEAAAGLVHKIPMGRWAQPEDLVGPVLFFASSASDYVILVLTVAPFATGLIAYFQWFDVRLFTLLHVLTGEAMLVAIPFTRISHMLLAPLTRGYMGSEFGGIRHARDW